MASQERAELMHTNASELASLMQKRLEKEEQYMEARRRRVDEDQRQLEGQRVQDNEDLNILKIKRTHRPRRCQVVTLGALRASAPPTQSACRGMQRVGMVR